MFLSFNFLLPAQNKLYRMKKVCFAILMIIVLPVFIEAQVTLQPNIPAVGLIQKNQLWNVLVINSSTKQYDCRLELILRDRATGQEVMTASGGQFTLQPGSKQLNVNSVAPVQYNYILAGIDNKMQGLLPAGLYTACYSLVSTMVKEADLAEECVQFDTEPLSPPMLIQPVDSSVLEVAPAQFSWIPPTPDGMFDRLQYDVIITAINDGQKANEAIEENLPFYNEGNHFTNMLSYPSSAPVFEKDKWYAWQVIARDNRDYAGKSEVWVFKVNQPSPVKAIIEQMPYIKMKMNNPEKGIAPNGVLKLSYVNEIADSLITIQLIDINDKSRIAGEFKTAVRRGENLVQYDLKKILHLQEGKLYEARIVNSRKEKWLLQFEIRQYNNKITSNN